MRVMPKGILNVKIWNWVIFIAILVGIIAYSNDVKIIETKVTSRKEMLQEPNGSNQAVTVVESSSAGIQVIKRIVEGKVWFDSNKDGLINNEEEYLSGVKVTLLNENGIVAKDIENKEIPSVETDENGYYKFEDMPKGKYKVKVEYSNADNTREITTKNVGTNKVINSKFNSDGLTDVITAVDVENVLEAKETNVNAGIIDNTTKTTGKIKIKYIDEDEKDIAPQEEREGKVGEEYKTEEKEIPYYELIERPVNKDGEYKEENQTVVYKYKKLSFNIAAEQTIEEISVDGTKKEISKDNNLAKIEIPESKLASSEIIVKYKMLVKNSGKLDGTAQIVESIPAGYEVADGNPTYWKTLTADKLIADVKLKAGEEKELEITLKCKNAKQSLGKIKNIVEITNIDNEPHFADNNADDNISVAEVIISVKTGIEIMSDILIISGTIGLVMLLIVAFIDQKMQKKE